MKKNCLVLKTLVAIASLLASVQWVAAQESAASTGPAVNLVVTVEARHGSNVPEINREDVMVYEGKDRDKVTGWLPLRGDHAGLEFFILLDDSSNVSLGSQLEDMRPVLTGADVLEMQAAVKHIRVDESLVSYALEIVRRTRESFQRSYGAIDSACTAMAAIIATASTG